LRGDRPAHSFLDFTLLREESKEKKPRRDIVAAQALFRLFWIYFSVRGTFQVIYFSLFSFFFVFCVEFRQEV
jgi:hypothetical protein